MNSIIAPVYVKESSISADADQGFTSSLYWQWSISKELANSETYVVQINDAVNTDNGIVFCKSSQIYTGAGFCVIADGRITFENYIRLAVRGNTNIYMFHIKVDFDNNSKTFIFTSVSVGTYTYQFLFLFYQ